MTAGLTAEVSLIRMPSGLPSFTNEGRCLLRDVGPHSGKRCLLLNEATQRPFTYDDACVERGAHFGYDPVAAHAARTAVNAFLKVVFKLD